MLNFDSAIHKHTLWKSRFLTAISQYETLDVAKIEMHDCCELGKWLLRDGHSTFSHLSSYAYCVLNHAEFHKEAGKIARFINEKKYAEAEAMLGDESHFSRLSYILLGAFSELEKEANS